MIGAVATAVYWPSLRGGWLWDDDPQFVSLPTMSAPDGLSRVWHGQTMQYYPLTFSVFWIVRHWFGLNTSVYRGLSLSLHVLSALLLWGLLAQCGIAEAWLAAMLFAVHPVQVESVAWIIELKNVLSGVFFFSSLLFYVRFEDSDHLGDYFGALGLFLLALLSKSSTVMLPVVLLIVRWWRGRPLSRPSAMRIAPFFLLSALMAPMTIWYERSTSAGGERWTLSVPAHLALAGRIVWFYLGKLAWPHSLIFLYPRWNFDSMSVLTFAPTAAVAIAAIMLWRLNRYESGRACSAGFAYFLVNLFPVLGFIRVFYMRYSYTADHFQYLASVGPITLAACGIGLLGQRFGQKARRAVIVVTLTGLSLATWSYAHSFESLDKLWVDVLSKNPDAFLAHNYVGLGLANQGRWDEAIAHYQAALRARPGFMEANNSWGNALLAQNKFEEAIPHYRAANASIPDYPGAYSNLGVALARLGRFQEAIAAFRQAVALEPMNRDFNKNLGLVLTEAGQPEEAAAHYQAVLARDPDDITVRNNLAALLPRLKSYQHASNANR